MLLLLALPLLPNQSIVVSPLPMLTIRARPTLQPAQVFDAKILLVYLEAGPRMIKTCRAVLALEEPYSALLLWLAGPRHPHPALVIPPTTS